MAYRLLLDENVEQEIGFRLKNYGHDVEHVDFVPELGKGVDDTQIADYSHSTDRLILTYDDDFVLEFDDDDYRAVLYVPDLSMPPADVADIVHEMSVHYPQPQVHGLERVSTEWL
ncbi:DUF5615 family PIN-like protein [Natronolimnohabitans innermongolicus]|uniref:DUF5615 domain-containing protein n=1 Tax=Natronolimnohabitans innermongolicus JCM 12255 TaxID=1227499 RepID=L9WQL0_9EURY|nr:hypothetical protein C493_17171 [Natronolimnohabitans innermongolicus JCM 12255]